MNILAPLALALCLAAPAAQATVVTFDDLSGVGAVADGYGGITWGNNWSHDVENGDPYNANSPFQRSYANAVDFDTSFQATSFSFLTDAVFGGAYFAGYGPSLGHAPVFFELFLDGLSMSISASLDVNAMPTFLGAGYSGLIDTVVVWGDAGYYVMDDVTYTTAAPVPVPAALPMLLLALGGLGVVARRRRPRL